MNTTSRIRTTTGSSPQHHPAPVRRRRGVAALLTLGALAGAGFAAIGPAGPAGATVPTTDADQVTSVGSCTWTVKGNLVVRNPTLDGVANNDPLQGVEVKVSGRSSIGWWNQWDTDVTDANGFFSVTKTECSNRAVKVEAKLESSSLRVTSSASKTWYELYDSGTTMGPSTIDLNREPFGGGAGEQATNQARTDAQTWVIYEEAIDYVADIGHPFTGKVKVHNPATLTTGVSAADPILQDIHIDPNDTNDLDAMLHELGHVHAYQHGTGEGCLTWDALLSGDTHGSQEDECVAFLEGMAEYFADKLEQELNETGRIVSSEGTSTTPFDRAKLAQTFGLVDLPTLGRQDTGWEHVLRVTMATDVTRWLFGTSTGTPGNVDTYGGGACSGQPVGQDDLADLLAIVGSTMDFSSVTVSSFLDRAATQLGTMDPTDADHYRQSINPSKTAEPHTLYGC
jgi:hypothetical protein